MFLSSFCSEVTAASVWSLWFASVHHRVFPGMLGTHPGLIHVPLWQVSLRKQEIADRLNAWIIFNEKNQELCEWLTQMENKVAHDSDLNIEEMVEKLKKVRRNKHLPKHPAPDVQMKCFGRVFVVC